MKSLYGIIVVYCSFITGCAALSSLDPFDDKEDVLITDVAVEAPAKKRHKHGSAANSTARQKPHSHDKKPKAAKAKPEGPRLAQNLPENAEDEPLALGTGIFEASAAGPDICQQGPLPCGAQGGSSELAATTCEIDGAVLASNQAPLVAWGPSECTAKRLLTAEVCRMGFKGIQPQHIICAPESQQVTCPPMPVICAPDDRAMVCTAKSYQGSPLQFSQYPKTWGVGECQTRYQLRTFACSLKLDPSQLGDITCELDYSQGECPVEQDAVCEGAEDEAKEFYVCESKSFAGTPFEVPLVTYGESRCEARAALMHMACQFSDSRNKLRPSLLENINCYSKLNPPKN